jgi:hypothetical protein
MLRVLQNNGFAIADAPCLCTLIGKGRALEFFAGSHCTLRGFMNAFLVVPLRF